MLDLDEAIRALGRKAAAMEPGINEEATKMALIVPFIRALGYDIFNPSEVVPEYTASTGNLKDARADYAILKDGVPFIVFECKALGTPLDVHKTQLEWYFTNSEAHIGVLTDGNRYIFYSDIKEKNKMDASPYMDFMLSSLDESFLPRLKMLSKDKFNEDEYKKHAERLKYSREFRRIIAEQFSAPDDEFSRLFISRVWDGKVMQSVLERFRPVLKNAMEQYLNDVLNERLSKAMQQNEDPRDEPTKEKQTQKKDTLGQTEPTDNQPTEEEKEAYYLVKSLLLGTIEPQRVSLRDFKSFCNILLDNSIQRPLLRLHFNKKPWRISFFDNDTKWDDKIEIENLDDIIRYADRIKGAALKYEAKKKD